MHPGESGHRGRVVLSTLPILEAGHLRVSAPRLASDAQFPAADEQKTAGAEVIALPFMLQYTLVGPIFVAGASIVALAGTLLFLCTKNADARGVGALLLGAGLGVPGTNIVAWLVL